MILFEREYLYNMSFCFQHLNPVCSLDWHPVTNLLLSASTDRGVIVWEEATDINGLKPQLAVIKETKSNVDAQWNHAGNKFCVGASSGNVFIGIYDEMSAFWTAQSISKNPLSRRLIIYLNYRWKETSSRSKCLRSQIRSIEWKSLCLGFRRWKMLFNFLLP